MNDSFSTRDILEVNGKRYQIRSLAKLGQRFDLKRLPYSMKILLENLLRHEDGANITAKEIEAVANWDAKKEPDTEIAFMPARVVLQDFTGVPCVVDLAAMRDAMKKLGGDPKKINPLSPAELVIDHSVQVDSFGNGRLARSQRQDRIRAQPRALLVPALGPEGVRQLQGGAAAHRHRASGQPRISRARRHGDREGRRVARVSGHRVRHRFAHDDDQRPRRARLGRRRHRGRGRDARAAFVDADSAGRRLQADRPAAGRRRPRPISC